MVDRWHLIQNLVEALERHLLRFRPALKAAAGMGDTILGPLPDPSGTGLVPWQQRAEAASQQKHASKVERYEQMRTLRDAGFTVVLAPYEPYLIRRWAEGCRNHSRLFREIRWCLCHDPDDV